MATLLVIGGGLFGSLAAAYARSRGITARVFDPGLDGAASPAAGCLFREAWASGKLREHYRRALPILDKLYGLRHVTLAGDDGSKEAFHFIPPSAILEPDPLRQRVTSVGDGWLEAAGERYEGAVYVAAGIWCAQLIPEMNVYGKAGSSYLFAGEREGRIRPIAHGRQAIAFVRDPGTTFFSDGTAERAFTEMHDRQTLERAATLGLTMPIHRLWGWRPYVPGGPLFRQVSRRTWVGTGGRKMGTILGASFARRLIEEEL